MFAKRKYLFYFKNTPTSKMVRKHTDAINRKNDISMSSI